jgi:hypothetical protein
LTTRPSKSLGEQITDQPPWLVLVLAHKLGRPTRLLFKIQDATLATTKLSKIKKEPCPVGHRSPLPVDRGGTQPPIRSLPLGGSQPGHVEFGHRPLPSTTLTACHTFSPHAPAQNSFRSETANLTDSIRSVKRKPKMVPAIFCEAGASVSARRHLGFSHGEIDSFTTTRACHPRAGNQVSSKCGRPGRPLVSARCARHRRRMPWPAIPFVDLDCTEA